MPRDPRTPCPSCPWRRSTPPGGFPGGCLDTARLRSMVAGDLGPAMQCHCTPDGERAQVCVGFALVVGWDCLGLRLAAAVGRFDPGAIATDAPLHTLESVLRTHGDIHLHRSGGPRG